MPEEFSHGGARRGTERGRTEGSPRRESAWRWLMAFPPKALRWAPGTTDCLRAFVPWSPLRHGRLAEPRLCEPLSRGEMFTGGSHEDTKAQRRESEAGICPARHARPDHTKIPSASFLPPCSPCPPCEPSYSPEPNTGDLCVTASRPWRGGPGIAGSANRAPRWRFRFRGNRLP